MQSKGINMDDINLKILLPVLFPFAFIAFWIFIVKLISRFAGWDQLTQKYRIVENFTPNVCKAGSARIKLANYSGCFKMGADHANLYIGVWFIFKFSHPNIAISLHEIQGIESSTLSFRYVILTFNQLPDIPIKISIKNAKKIESLSHGYWQFQRME